LYGWLSLLFLSGGQVVFSIAIALEVVLDVCLVFLYLPAEQQSILPVGEGIQYLVPPEECSAQCYAAPAGGIPQGKSQCKCLQVGFPGLLAVFALVSHRPGGLSERASALLAEVPLLAPDEAVAMDMVAGTMRATGCSLIDLWVLIEGYWRLLNKFHDQLEILLCKIPEHFRHCLKIAGFLFVA
jgi:hypothetical protein